MSTILEAQRALFQKGKNTKIFIVPLILSYHFVLEAQFLIEQHLKQIGKERYIRSKDDFHSIRRQLRFAWQFFSESNDITLSFGQPMDVLGNPVDINGESFDQYGMRIKLEEYFMSGGEITEDLQRESEYTKMLGDRIVDRYFKDNIVLTSHLVAFAAFEILKNQNSRLDLYGILRLPTDDFVITMEAMAEVASQLKERLVEMSQEGNIKLSEQILWEIDHLIKDGISRLGTYHLAKPLRFLKDGTIASESFKLLYFYHNRLDNYGLEDSIQWKKYVLEMV